jgi:hypothetical protein
MNVITSSSLAVALCVASFASFADTAAAPCVASGLQKTIVAKSEQGVDALRDYLFITRGIYNVTMDEAVAMVERQRAAQRGCSAKVAVADTSH